MWSHNKDVVRGRTSRYTRHKFLLVTVEEWLKSLLKYRSYPKNKLGVPFFGPPCMIMPRRQRLVDQGGNFEKLDADRPQC